MNMKKVIAAALVVGTMTMTGMAFAGPRVHDRHHGRGGSESRRWVQQERHGRPRGGHRHVETGRRRRPGQNQMKQKGWTRKDWGVRGKSPIFTPGGGGKHRPRGRGPAKHGGHGFQRHEDRRNHGGMRRWDR